MTLKTVAALSAVWGMNSGCIILCHWTRCSCLWYGQAWNRGFVGVTDTIKLYWILQLWQLAGSFPGYLYTSRNVAGTNASVLVCRFASPAGRHYFTLICSDDLSCQLTFSSLVVSLRTTRFNIQQFYMVLALRWVFCADLRTDGDFCFVHH